MLFFDVLIKLFLFNPSSLGNLSQQTYPLRLSSYKIKIEKCQVQNKTWISLREFKLDDKRSRWMVDPQFLETDIIPYEDAKNCQAINVEKILATPKLPSEFNFEYFRALKKSNTFPGHLQGQGIASDYRHRSDNFLTIDLCPSKKLLDRAFFEKIHQNNWPVAIAISGLWILRHPDDWEWLRTQLDPKETIWVNHSRNHPVYADQPIEKNYLLSEGRDIQREIIDNEKLLLQRGITPSIFFRFPGLVANLEALQITLKLGLVTLGSNSWLGKGQKPKPGSIILVHGNGNDPKGLARFEEYWKQNKFSLPFHRLLDIFK